MEDGIGQIGQIADEQYDGKSNANRIDINDRMLFTNSAALPNGLCQGWQNQADDCQRQHRGILPGVARIKILSSMTPAADQERGSQDQQGIANNGAGNGSAHDIQQPGVKSYNADNQFRGVAKRCVEQPANKRAYLFC